MPGIFNFSDVMVNTGMVISLAAVFFHPEKALDEPDDIETGELETDDRVLSEEDILKSEPSVEGPPELGEV